MSVTLNGTNGLTFNDGSSQSTGAFYGGLAFRNRIINGAMMIDQRNAGASVTNGAGTTTYTLDRWALYGDQASKFTVQQSSTAATGFINSLLVTSSSSYSVGASEIFNIQQRIEGLNCADLAWGTANAATVTISFWVRSSLTGTFGGSIMNSAENRNYPFTYTISSANTWEQKTVTIPGDQSGTWLTTNGLGIRIFFSIGTGSSSSGTAGAWAAGAKYSATGATSVVGTNGATFYITGVQLEKGSTATSFDYRPYGTELALCQRYYQMSFNQGTAPADGISATVNSIANAYATGAVYTSYTNFPVAMRTNPTMTPYRADGATNGQWATYDGGWTSGTSTSFNATANGFNVQISRSGAFTVKSGYLVDGQYTASAEL